MSTIVASQIELDDRGVAWIVGANTKVVEVALDKIAYGWSAEEMHFQHAHLSLAQIHSALAYYYANQEQLDAQIERDYQKAETLLARLPEPPFVERLRKLKNAK